MLTDTADCRLAAVVGPGRSGTTWAGTLIDSSPEVIYRFEPFHRLSKVDAAAARWFDRLKAQDVSEPDLPRLYEMLRPANPLTNKAPFFADKSYPVGTLGRSAFWPVARLLSPARWVYAQAYSPKPGPPLVFKEVTFVKPLKNLLERTSLPVVYLVRHPCATVHSMVKGPDDGTMSSKHVRLERALQEHAPWLLDEFAGVLRGSDRVCRTALLWRCEVETCVNLVRRSERALLMTYEQLVSDPVVHTRRMFGHFGIEFGQPTLDFIESLYRISGAEGATVRRTGWGDRYFSVMRNPATQKDSWKRSMSNDDRRKVEAVVRNSPIIEYCASRGQWW